MIKTQTVTCSSSASTTIIHDAGFLTGLDALDAMQIVATLTGPTGGNLDVYLQVAESSASAPTWIDYAHFSVTAGAVATSYVISVARFTQQLTPITIGVGNTPVLASACIGGDFGERMRIITVTGVGVTAGAAQTIRLIGSASKRRV